MSELVCVCVCVCILVQDRATLVWWGWWGRELCTKSVVEVRVVKKGGELGEEVVVVAEEADDGYTPE